MNRFSMGKSFQSLVSVLAVGGAFAVLFSGDPTLAADMDKNAKALAKVDDDWSNAAVKRDVDRVASFYAEDAIVYPPNEPVAIGQPAAKKV